MGKLNEMIVLYSESDNDSLELIDPVTNLSLEHAEKKKSIEEFDDQSNRLENIHLNDSKKKEKKRSRHHPYQHLNKSKRINQKRKESSSNYDMKYLKSLGYIEYSSTKESKNEEIRSLVVQLNHSIEQIFQKYIKSDQTSKTNHYICNRRFK